MTNSKQLVVHTEYSKGWGGQEIRIIEELRELRRLGVDVALIAPEDSKIYQHAKDERLTVYPFAFRSKLDIFSWIRLYHLFRSISPTIVNTHSSEDSWLGGAVARFVGVPLIIRTRHVSTPIGSTFSYRVFPHLILTTSQAIRRDLMEKGIDGQNITSVPTGIDLQRFKFNKENRSRIRAELGIADGEILIGNVCVLRSWKGIDFLVETAAIMPKGFRFIVIGDGPQMKQLQEKANGLGLDGKKIIFTGHQKQVERYFSALDVFFFTSYASEGVPQSLLQAITNGLPIVACKTPSVEETLRGVVSTEFVTYGETMEAALILQEIANHSAACEDSIRNDNSQILVKYGLSEMTHTLMDLYRRYGVDLHMQKEQ